MNVCLSSGLIYPVCNACGSYYTVIYDLSDCIIFFCISHKRHDFRENLIENNICTFIMSEKIYHCKKIHSDVFISVPRSACNVPFNPLRFYSYLNFLYRFCNNPKISSVMPIRLMGAELIHAGGRTVGRID
jgi:hypothetical protein